MGAICKHCNRDMLASRGCVRVPVRLINIETGRTKNFSPIRVGTSGDLMQVERGETCHDCGAHYGFFHHPGCDSETCPQCLGQVFGCECERPHEDPDSARGLRS